MTQMFSFHTWQYIIVFLVLLIGTPVAHWALLYKFPRSLIFWKEVDYFWLFASVVAVFLAVAANQFNDANSVEESAHRRYLDAQKEFNDAVERTNNFDCKKSNIKNKDIYNYCNWRDEFNVQRKTFEKINGFTKNYWDHLNKYPVKDQKYYNLKWASDFQQTGLIEYNIAYENSQKSENFIIFNFSLVLFLCVLLAVRITKITADVLVEKFKAKEINLPKNGFPVLGEKRRKFLIDEENKKEISKNSDNAEILKVLAEIKEDLVKIIEKLKF